MNCNEFEACEIALCGWLRERLLAGFSFMDYGTCVVFGARLNEFPYVGEVRMQARLTWLPFEICESTGRDWR